MTSTEAIDCSGLKRGSVISVETKNRHYEIECLGGTAIRICGHPEYCPEPVSARVQGSVDKQGALEFGLITRGMRLVFLLNDHRPITTTRVMRLRLDRSKVAPSSPSVH